MKKDSFVFYRSFWESVKALPLEIQHEILTAIIEFGLDKQEPQLTDPYANALWQLIKPQLDANWRKFENGCKGAIHGVKGGNPNFGKGKTNPYYSKDNPKDNPNITPNDNVNDNDNDNVLSLIERQEKFREEVLSYREHFDINMLRKFYTHWTEPDNKTGQTMRWEAEEYWDTLKRLQSYAVLWQK